MVGDGEGRQKAADQQEDQASLADIQPPRKFQVPWWLSSKESACQCRRCGFDRWIGRFLWRRKWQPTPVFLPGESHGQRSLVGCSPWGCKGLDTTERLNNNHHLDLKGRELRSLFPQCQKLSIYALQCISRPSPFLI